MSHFFQMYVTRSFGHLDVLWRENTDFKMPYYKNKGCYRAENLQNGMYLGCSITKES